MIILKNMQQAQDYAKRFFKEQFNCSPHKHTENTVILMFSSCNLDDMRELLIEIPLVTK